MRPKKVTQKSAKSTTVTGKAVKGFADEERVAMKERAQGPLFRRFFCAGRN